MVYAVSGRTIRGAPGRGASLVARPRRRPHASLSIHWPRVIALGVNVLVWAVVIAVAARAPHL